MVAHTLSRWTPVLSVVELTLLLNNPSQWKAHKINIINEHVLKGCFITDCHCRLKKRYSGAVPYLNEALFFLQPSENMKQAGFFCFFICHPERYEQGIAIFKSEGGFWFWPYCFQKAYFYHPIYISTIHHLSSFHYKITIHKKKMCLSLSLYSYLETISTVKAHFCSTSGSNLAYFIYRPWSVLFFSLREKDNKYFLVPSLKKGLWIKIKKSPG